MKSVLVVGSEHRRQRSGPAPPLSLLFGGGRGRRIGGRWQRFAETLARLQISRLPPLPLSCFQLLALSPYLMQQALRGGKKGGEIIFFLHVMHHRYLKNQCRGAFFGHHVNKAHGDTPLAC